MWGWLACADPPDPSTTRATSTGTTGTTGLTGETGAPAPVEVGGFTGPDDPVFAGQYGVLAGDPSVWVRPDGRLGLVYTCYAADTAGADTCLAVSDDGLVWTAVDTGDPVTDGRILYPGSWDAAHETPYAVPDGEGVDLWAVGYSDPVGGFLSSGDASVGRYRSDDGVSFAAVGAGPVVAPHPGGLDRNGISSPTVLPDADGYRIVYTGWCVEADCPGFDDGVYVHLLTATSTDGAAWGEPVEVDVGSAGAWMAGGVAETHLVELPDHRWALLFSTVAEPHAIGLAYGDAPTGPFTPSPAPVIEGRGTWGSGGVVAPHGLVDGDRLRVWYAGIELDGSGAQVAYRIGVAEAPLTGG